MSTLSMKFLSGLGIDDDKAELICERHKEVLTEIKDERDALKEKAEQYDAVQKQLNEYKDAEKKAEKDPYKVKYEALKEEYDKYKQDIEAKETMAKKTDAYKQLLKDAGVSDKRIEAVLKVSDIGGLEFDNEGKVKDADKLTESIKTEWADFIPTTKVEGAKTPTPPASNNDKKDLGKLSMADYIKARKEM